MGFALPLSLEFVQTPLDVREGSEVVLADARGCRGFGAAHYKNNLATGRARAWLRLASRDRPAILELCGIDLDCFVDFGLPHLDAVWREIDELKLKPRYVHTFRRKAT